MKEKRFIYASKAVQWLTCNTESGCDAPYLLLKLTLMLLKNKEMRSSICCFPGSQAVRTRPEPC